MISPVRALLLFYLIPMSNYTSPILGTQLRDFAGENRYFQHAVGYISMLVLLSEFNQISGLTDLFFVTTALYFLFILTTKLELQWNLALLILLVGAYLWNLHFHKKEVESIQDQSMEQEDIEKMSQKHDSYRTLIFVTVAVVAVIGTTLYLQRKRVQYGGNFDLEKYLLQGRN